MNYLHYITKGVTISSLVINGYDRDRDMGIVIDLDDPNDYVDIWRLTIRDTFVPVTVRRGNLRVREVINRGYGGDLLDVFGGRAEIDYVFSRNNTPTRPYEIYHQDVAQLDYLTNYKSDPTKTMRDTIIRNLDIIVDGPKAQGISLTGSCDYVGIQIGIESFSMLLDGYPHDINAFQARRSVFGGPNNHLLGDVFIKNRNNRNSHETKDVFLSDLKFNPYSDKRGIHHLNVDNLTVPEYYAYLANMGAMA